MERNGKHEDGSYGGLISTFSDPTVKNAKGAGQGVIGGAQSVGSGLASGAQSADGYVGEIFSGRHKGEPAVEKKET